jgi:hypothetical protein
MPEFNPSLDYSDEYWKIYLENEISCALIREVAEKKTQLNELVEQIEVPPASPRTSRTNTTA